MGCFWFSCSSEGRDAWRNGGGRGFGEGEKRQAFVKGATSASARVMHAANGSASNVKYIARRLNLPPQLFVSLFSPYFICVC